MKRIFKLNILTDEELAEFKTNAVELEEKAKFQFDLGFREGVNHVFNAIQSTITTNNPNNVFKVSYLNNNQLMFLFKAITGAYFKRPESKQ